jgi:hypothetical protein
MIKSATSKISNKNNISRVGAMPIISRLAFGSNVATHLNYDTSAEVWE